MGLEDRTKCWCYGPEPSHWAAGSRPTRGQHGPHSLCNPQGQGTDSALSWGGRDHMDGQILGQLRPLAEEEEEDGAALAPRPAFPGMGSEELRLASFYDWPLSAVVPPELLAAAGFFHTGQQDKVRCFFCYGGLQSWERGDDPWTEHARWFPRCEFLLRTKGRDFVCRVQESCCCPPGSWDRSEEPEDVGPATLSGERGCVACAGSLGTSGPHHGGSTGHCACIQGSGEDPATPELAAVGMASPETDVGGGQEWPAWSQCPAVQAVLRMGFRPGQVQGLLQRKYHQVAPTGMSTSQLVADLLQEEDGGRVVGARAPVPPGPELLTPRIEAQVESALESAEGPPRGEPGGAQDAEEQLRRLREERTCRVCLDRTVGVVFVPCGHLACAECAPSLQQCPICRAPIRSCVRTFLS
ncbi:baculoviral IAP repeat-containing protein 7 [Bos indicus x Bos taurus]|uniref:baculoviral IAP repeat-containing protein 7 n=1 Tax=Bos indicus x Bos taurus TaxID=30522 RepID=UPI000F7D2608|nr:baculoviral IAP repeat-containing protein 7 [Bos indicus x Bos taurus]